MAASLPYAQIVGVCKFYLAAASTAEPTVNTTPGAAWTEIGATDGEQSVEITGALTYFMDNDHQSDVKAVRPEEHVELKFTLVGMTLEHFARVLSSVSAVVAAAGPPATKKLPFLRGAIPTEYAILMKGEADSPYGNFPGQNYFPRGVFDGEPTLTRAKDGRVGIECVFHVLEDDTQAAADRLGWATVQTA